MSSKPVAPSLLDPAILLPAFKAAFTKLDPRQLVRNPVIFVTEVVAAMVTVFFIRDLATGTGTPLFSGQIAAWLWFTVLFATFAEAVAEGRGKAQADSLRRTKSELTARKLVSAEGRETQTIPATIAEGRRSRAGRSRRTDPRRRRRRRGCRLGQRKRHHRRIRTRDPRVRRRPLRRHRRHAACCPTGSRCASTRRPGDTLRRPHDRAHRRRAAPEDPERDRADDPARRA